MNKRFLLDVLGIIAAILCAIITVYGRTSGYWRIEK